MDALMIDTLSKPLPIGRFSAVRSALTMLRVLYVMSIAITLINPAFSGRTIYLYLLLPALDLEFLARLLHLKASRYRVLSFSAVLILVMLSLHDVVFIIKFSLVLFQVVYLLFLTNRNLAHYLFITLIAHIVFALLQMGFFFFNRDLLFYVTPGYLAGLIWGEKYAAATFANFGFEFLLPRFSGLYRESGFFNSYLIALYLFFSSEKSYRLRKIAFALILVGLFLSFSKITITFVFILILMQFRKYLNRIPLYLSSVGYLFVMHFTSIWIFNKIYSNLLYDTSGKSESFMLRFLSYYGLKFFDVKSFLIGPDSSLLTIPELSEISNTLYNTIGGLTEDFLFCGFAGILYKGGIIGLAMFVMYLMYMGVKTTPFLILLFLTFSVTLDTLQSFVILGWYFALKDTWFGSGLLTVFRNDRHKSTATAGFLAVRQI